MPTARELLEQADALMRRNRLDVHDDIPVLTDAVPARTDAPRPATSGAYLDFAAGDAGGPASVPTLTDRVDTHLPEADSIAMEGEPSDWLDFDDVEPSVIGDAPDSIAIVPPVDRLQQPNEALLQSAEHEEIELTLPVDDEFEREFDAGLPDTSPRSREIHGGAAPTTAKALAAFTRDDVVLPADRDGEDATMEPPEVEEVSEQAPDGVSVAATEGIVSDEFLRDEPAMPRLHAEASPHTTPIDHSHESRPSTVNYEVTILGADAPAASLPADVSPMADAGTAASDADSALPLAADRNQPAIGGEFTIATPARAPRHLPAAAAEPPHRAPAPDAWGVEVGVPVGGGAPEPLDPRRQSPDAVTPSAASLTAALAAAIPVAAMPATPAQIALDAAGEKAQWDAIAEEIRMQVLQRIDLFTDTGLREQLGAQLKPIVDRASADLVATINLHVGDLLRAYVAEAIEREIELWRRDN